MSDTRGILTQIEEAQRVVAHQMKCAYRIGLNHGRNKQSGETDITAVQKAVLENYINELRKDHTDECILAAINEFMSEVDV